MWRCWLVAATLAAADGRRHRYGIGGGASKEPSTSREPPPPPPVPETFLRDMVASFKANEDAESLVFPCSLSRAERRLVHIYAAKQGLGHKSTGGARGSERSIMLKKDEAWLARRKRRYIEAETSEPLDLETTETRSSTGPGLLRQSWLVAVAAYFL